MGLIDKAKLLFKTSRPVVWTWFAAPFLVGFILSGADIDRLIPQLQFIALGPLYSLYIYGINDIYDYKTGLQNDRKGEGKVQGDVLKPENHGLVMKSSILAAFIIILLALITVNITNILGMIFLLILGYTYSAPPARLKGVPVIDSISNGLGYLLIPFMTGFSLGAPITQAPVSVYWVASVVAGLHAMFAVFDYKPDKKADVKTIAVYFGPKKTIIAPIAIILGTLIFSPMQSLTARILLLELLTLNLLIALDLNEVFEFKKSFRDKLLAFIYVNSMILVAYFVIKNRFGIL